MGDNLILPRSRILREIQLGGIDVPYWCEAILINGPWSEISNIPHGIGVANRKPTEPIWDFIYEVLVELVLAY